MSSGDMMQLSGLKTFLVDLPFRFSFSHNLAKRSSSTNVFVKVVLHDNTVDFAGLGESVPRDYVSGESAPDCWRYLNDVLFPRLRNGSFENLSSLANLIESVWHDNNLDVKPHGASFCAMELALFDAFCRAKNIPLYQLPHLLASTLPSLDNNKNNFWSDVSAEAVLFVDYGGVVPFAGGAFLSTMLNFYKSYNFSTVKLKVGTSIEDNVLAIKLAREILADDVILRIDANCAWDLLSAQRHLEALRPFGVVSVEEPLAKDDLKNLARLKAAIPEKIIVDESLTTLEQGKRLIEMDACSGFNVRLSKLGGILASMKMVELAYKNNIEVHLGAQVGESGVLASAQRHFAGALSSCENVEGAMNLFLLKRDMTRQCLTVPFGGRARVSREAGLGVSLSLAGSRHLGHFPPSFAAPAYGLNTPHELTVVALGSR